MGWSRFWQQTHEHTFVILESLSQMKRIIYILRYWSQFVEIKGINYVASDPSHIQQQQAATPWLFPRWLQASDNCNQGGHRSKEPPEPETPSYSWYPANICCLLGQQTTNKLLRNKYLLWNIRDITSQMFKSLLIFLRK